MLDVIVNIQKRYTFLVTVKHCIQSFNSQMSAVEHENHQQPASPLPIIPQDEQATQLRTLRESTNQQQALIGVLKSQITKLQNENIELQAKRIDMEKLYNEAQQLIETQKEKIETLRENNQSIIHTFQVFQREFVKRDYKSGINIHIEREKAGNSDGPLFLQLIRNMKNKITDSTNQIKEEKKSQLNQYYGYYFNEEIQDKEKEFYTQIKEKMLVMGETLSLQSKIRSFGRKNYFNQHYRHWFWLHMMGRPLRITQGLYQNLQRKCQLNKQQIQQQGRVSLIDRDLNRMDLKLEDDKGKAMKTSIRKCLQLFEVYRTDIGYIQGMSYLAWMFLIRMPDFEAFSCFSSLVLCDHFVSSLYFFKQDKIKKIKQFYQKCMQDKKPKLHKHMKTLQVECEFFIIEWAYTMFTRAFNLRISSKIWDLWLSEGYTVFYKVVLAIMDMLEPEILLIQENDKVIEFIRTQTHKLEEGELLKNIRKMKVSQQFQL